MNNLFIFGIIIAIASFIQFQVLCLSPEIEDAIDKLVQESFIPLYEIPGFGLAIFNEDDTVNPSMTRGYGFSNLEDGLEANSSTLFSIGSISKSLTGLLAVKVLSETFPELGEGVLDIPIRELLPSINFTLIDRFRSENVNFRDLLSHRVCVTPDRLGQTTLPYKSVFEYLYRQRYAPEQCGFRTQWIYNNGGFVMASELLGKIAGKPLGELVTDFMKEIGMTQSTYFQMGVDYNTLPNMSRAYYRNGTETKQFSSELLKRVSFAIGAGGIISSPNDMLKYIQFNLQNGKLGDRQIITEEAMSWIRKTSNAVPFEGWRKNGTQIEFGDFAYGLGINIGAHDGYQMISHGGYVAPFLSFLTYYPDLKMGIFSCMNGPGWLPTGADLPYLHSKIFEILNEESPIWDHNEVMELKSRWTNTFSSSTRHKPKAITGESGLTIAEAFQADVLGLYGNGLSGEFLIKLKEGSTTGELSIEYGEWGNGTLSPRNSTLYELHWEGDLAQELYTHGPILPPPLLIDFGQVDKAIVVWYEGDGIVFEKGLTLERLPVQPWEPEEGCPPGSNAGVTVGTKSIWLIFTTLLFISLAYGVIVK